MDRNTTTGLLLMFLLVLGYNWYFGEEEPSPEQQQEQVAQADARVGQANDSIAATAGNVDAVSASDLENDSLKQVRVQEALNSKYGVFAPAGEGLNTAITLANNRVEVKINTHGGWFQSAQLKNGYRAFWDSTSVELFDQDMSQIDLWLTYPSKGLVNASDLYFQVVKQEKTADGELLVLRLPTTDAQAYIEYHYLLANDGYDVKVDIHAMGLQSTLDLPATRLDWKAAGKHLEKGVDWERQHSSVFYREMGKGRDYLGEGRENEEQIEEPLNWMAFKQNFFSALVIAPDGFGAGAYVRSYPPADEGDTTANMYYEARLPLQLAAAPITSQKLQFYFGPNDLPEMRKLEVDELDRIIDYGWWIFGWLNRWIVLPVFNWMFSIFGNIGLTIIALTLLIKLILTPITWKNFLSSAKMRVLKPEMDALNEKFKDDAMGKQTATMALYRETGVNPFAGCLPMLLQMPILYAMFRFFPANIDMRGKQFLWADDLGAYDAIITWTTEIPVVSGIYGNHVSGFALLMAVSTFFYSRMSTANMPTSTQPGMPNMKVIMNIFPVITLIFFNKFAAGLNFYYFCANMFSIGQMMLIKRFLIDEDKIHAKIQANKATPKKKSSFQQRLEEMQKLQQERAKQNPRKK
jgi:YidC/Oxa1 family membrane protein insertase